MIGLLALLTPRTLFWAAILALLLALGGQTVRLSWAQLDLVKLEKDVADERLAREEAARKAEQHNAALAAQHAREQQEAADDYSREKESLQRDLSAARLASLQLPQIERAPGDSGAAVDAAQCERFRNQANTARRVLGRADRLAEVLASGAEREAARVRLLLKQVTADRKACENGSG